MNALSWADLTYVLPATSLGYVLLALVAKFALHEEVSPLRWLGIALISGGVGFVAGGPALTANDDAVEAKSAAFESGEGSLAGKSGEDGARAAEAVSSGVQR